MKILFKLTTRSRPEKALKCIENIVSLCNSDNYKILVTADNDDDSMLWFGHNKAQVIYGKSKNKIDAVNRDINYVEDWDIIVSTSDDMIFTVKGFDDIIRQDFGTNLDQLLHYNDGNQKDNVCTLSIMGKEYYDRFGYIYYPGYESLWCDVEATEVAYLLGKYKYMGNDKVLFRHMHPAWGLSEWDEQYKKTEDPKVNIRDKELFLMRRSKLYDLTKEMIINNYKYSSL